ncbi:MAG: hypothetical protein ACFCD0_26800 [Gemmataceae bacterium]
MAVDVRKQNASVRHFLTRSLGLIGLMVGLIGLVVSTAYPTVVSWGLAIGGGVVVLLALAFELPRLFSVVATGRGTFASNVFVQVALAVVVLVGLNAFSFLHYARFDWTRNQLFTIDPEIVQDLSRLRGETTIVVFQRHTSFGGAEKAGHYEAAAERKIVAKVRDLVDQFQEYRAGTDGPTFQVLHLDIQDEDYEKKLKGIQADMPKLAEAVERTPESSVFFYSQVTTDDGEEENVAPRIQRLSFHDIYQLDLKASQEEQNLVLNYQGEGPFARKILNIEEPRPKVVMAVVHPVLGLDGREEIGFPGLKKSLESHGFECADIILKDKWGRAELPEPTAKTYAEYDYSDNEQKIAVLEKTIETGKKLVKDLKEKLSLFGKDLEKVNQEVVWVRELGGRWELLRKSDLAAWKKDKTSPETAAVTEAEQQQQLLRLNILLEAKDRRLKSSQEKYEASLQSLEALDVEEAEELKRIADVRTKFQRLLADADLLVIPRVTQLDLSNGEVLRNYYHHLSKEHVLAIKNFMSSGKPVMFCLGPPQVPPGNEQQALMLPEPSPSLESLLVDLGFRLPKQTVLFDAEIDAFAPGEIGAFRRPKEVNIPQVDFDWASGMSVPPTLRFGKNNAKEKQNDDQEHPLRTSLKVASRAFGTEAPFSLRHPRPVYYQPKQDSPPRETNVFLLSDPASWNENDPFPKLTETPQFRPPEKGDPEIGTLAEKRQGPFPLGVAAETKIPKDWSDSKDKTKTANSVRVAVIGHGGLFAGNELDPMQEKVFLDTCNWLLGRNDLLAKASLEPSTYARVEMTRPEFELWHWGTFLGLPGLMVFLGLVVLMFRSIW